MRNKLTPKEKINCKSAISVKSLEYNESGNYKTEIIAVSIEHKIIENDDTEIAVFITTGSNAITTISPYIVESVTDLINLISDGEISDDEILSIVFHKRTSNSGREYFQITID